MKRFTMLFAIILFSILAMSFQLNDPVKAIVLINGEAYLVDITPKGNITATYQKINNYFSSNESHNALLTRLSKGSREEGSNSIVFYEKESEPIVPFTIENKQPVSPGNAQYIGFSPRRALLKTDAVNQIRVIAKQYKEGIIQRVHITSNHRDTYESRALARNRAQAIGDLLTAFGLPPSIIEKDNPFAGPGSNTDFVQINF